MNHRLRFLFSLCFFLTVFLAASGPAKGQGQKNDSPSHHPVPGEPIDPDQAEHLLAQRLRLVQGDDLLQKILKDFKPEKMSKEQLKSLQNLAAKYNKKPLDLNDPKVKKLLKENPDFADVVEKVKKLNAGGDISPADLEALKKLAEKDKGEAPDATNPQLIDLAKKILDKQGGGSPADTKLLEDLLKDAGGLVDLKGNPAAAGPPLFGDPPSGAPQPGQPGPGSKQIEPPTGASPTPHEVKPPMLPEWHSDQPPTPAQTGWMDKMMLNLAANMKEWDGGAKDSLSTLLTDMATGHGSKSSDPSSSIDLAKMGDSVPTDKVNQLGSWLGNVKLPSLPHAGPFTPSAPNLGGTGGGSGGVDGGLAIFLGAIVMVVLGFVAWKLFGSYKATQANKANNPWRLGAWPVPPARVRTRADLVKAFEYLALLCLGRSAETRNHLELGDEIGQTAPVQDPRRGAAAQTLAHLYELARYTPDDETLPADEMATARRELSFLAASPNPLSSCGATA